ncbi:hypothetical protein RXV94_07360 [Yeosuana sp. MJ-SS3]|uniref:Right-handed parallel beta-helix repeat-containing protein n=1 Tax=Gilvirhabdus luticola TaxID=3079858 RepID=A0ABU3U6E0_9FLAO|nr:hypothetical protein [Yeosuana sp. MJ-SS3]MDU8885973.1 hypothetical protein [Yeosuana sp. MJ-SS3]
MKNFMSFSKRALIFSSLLFSVALISAQTTWTVNNNPNVSADFTDLQAAINDVSVMNGDILYVQHSPTSYGGNIDLSKSLTIIGRSHADVGYTTTIGTLRVTGGADGSTVKGCRINSISAVGSGSTIDGLSFYDNSIGSFDLNNNHDFTNTTIKGNIFTNNLTIRSVMSNVTITNNIFLGGSNTFYEVDTVFYSYNVIGFNGNFTLSNYDTDNSQQLNISNCIFVSNSAADRTIILNANNTNIVQVDNCVTYNYGSGSHVFETDTYITINGNVQENTNPNFTSVDTGNSQSIAGTGSNYDPLNDDLTLQDGAGLFGSEGLYEGYNFINLGLPTGYPSVKILSHDPTIAKNGNLSVTIEAKTN